MYGAYVLKMSQLKYKKLVNKEKKKVKEKEKK